MKKYLMTGVAALAFAATFTSCSKSGDLYDEKAVEQQKTETINANYVAAFEKAFGKVGSNVDWGFSSKAKTRTWNVNGNQWHDPAYLNLENDAPVTKEEMNKVFNYVNNKNNVVTVDQISLTKYWVSQIWNGKDDANAQGVKAPTSISYPNQNGATTTIVGGGQMDKLEILEKAGTWTHCNNFNHADNTDWTEGGEGGRTLMVESGTLSFRYTNSQSSYLSEKYIIVPGENIDASLKGFYYVCFDFERGYVAGEEEKTMGSYEAWNGNNYQGGWNFSLDGFLNEEEVKAAIGQVNGKDIQNINIKGYLYGDKHCDGDDNYTDWIVRISPARTKTTPLYRVIAEDLSASDESDFDFNDVVFDVVKYENGKTTLRLQACGGTLPLKVGGHEVHKLYGEDGPDATTGKYKMWNTGRNSHDPVDFEVDGEFTTPELLLLLPITVEKEGVWMPLPATKGVAACKILVDDRFPIVPERHSIANENGNFTTYVQGNWKDEDDFWWIQTK
jgi:hypothetical protein